MREAVAEALDRDACGITEGGEDNVLSCWDGGANAREEDGGGDGTVEKIRIFITMPAFPRRQQQSQ